MLSHIHIRNLAIVDEIDVELDAGMTALTGETGAGKSILVDALGLVLGDRADSGVIRHGCDRAEISAGFEIGDHPAVTAWLAERELDLDGECQLRRVISRAGRSRGYINGQPAPVQSLRELGEMLVDIHGQHEHQSLLRSAVRMRFSCSLSSSAAGSAAAAAGRFPGTVGGLIPNRVGRPSAGLAGFAPPAFAYLDPGKLDNLGILTVE